MFLQSCIMMNQSPNQNLDMINEKIVELKGICQFLDFQEGKEAEVEQCSQVRGNHAQ